MPSGARQTPTVFVSYLQYLQDVDCPLSLEPGGSNTQAVLQWLLNYAVSLEYADAGGLRRGPMQHAECTA